MPVAEWKLTGPALLSHERGDPGFLGVSYTDNVDTRFDSGPRLGPLITTVDLSGASGTAAQCPPYGLELSGPMNTVEFLYVLRGTKWGKVKVSDMTRVVEASTALGEAGTCIKRVKNVAGTSQIIVCMGSTDYNCITTVADAGSNDTHAVNSGGYTFRIVADATPADTIVGLGKAAGSIENVVAFLALTGSVVPSTGTWTTKNAIAGENLTFTGFALDGDAWIPGTNDGPVYSDANFNGSFRTLIPEIPLDANNCAGMKSSSFLGVVIPLSMGLRAQRNILSGGPIGTEVYRDNTSPVRGLTSAYEPGMRWDWCVKYNGTDSYLCAMGAPQTSDWNWGSGAEVSYYPLAKFSAAVCNALKFIDKAGGRTLPTLVGGYGTTDAKGDMFWLSMGRTENEYEDTSYVYAASGSVFGTEMRRSPDKLKKILAVEFDAEDCTSTETITVKFTYRDMHGVNRTETLGVANTNGFQQFVAPKDKPIVGWNPAIQVDFARGGTTTLSPSIMQGRVRVYYEEELPKVDGATLADKIKRLVGMA